MRVKTLVKNIFFRMAWVYILLFAGLTALINERVISVRVVNNLGNQIIALNKAVASNQAPSRQQLFMTLRFLDSFARLSPKSPFLYTTMAHCYVLLDETKTAIANYQRALKINPSLVGVYHNLGVLYLQQKEWDQAVHWLTIGKETEPYGGTHRSAVMMSPYSPLESSIVKQYGALYGNIDQLIEQAQKRDSSGMGKDRMIFYAMTRF